MAIFISSKFSEKNAQYDGIALKYGVNAFSSVDEAYQLLGTISDDVIFADSQVTLTAKEAEILHGTVYGKADIDGDENGDYIYISEFSNVKANSTLIIKDVPGSEGSAYPYNVNFSKVEVSNSQVGTIEKDAYYTSSVSKKDSQDMVTEKDNYKADGSVTVKNSSVGSVINYATVSLNNSSAGAIICKQSYKSEAYGYWMEEDEGNGWVDTSWGGEYEIDYSAGGTLNITLDKNADGVYNIGGGDYWYGDPESYRVFGVIDGYNKVTITGLDAAKNPDNGSYICVNGSIVGGQRFLDYYYGMNHWDMDSSGTVKISNGVAVEGAVAYFNSVTIAANSKTGAIINGDGPVSVKHKQSQEKSQDPMYDRLYVLTVTETISLTGSVTVSDSSVGDIVDYKTVKITNSDTGRITLDAETQQVVKYFSDSKLDEDAEDMSQPSVYNSYYTADGSLTVKIDKNAANDSYYIGRESEYGSFEGIESFKENNPYDEVSENKAIVRYKQVDIAGYTDKKNSDNNKFVYVEGDIIGGDAFVLNDFNYGETESSIYASGSATLSNVEARDIKGYTTVKLTDSAVGNVDKMDNKATVKAKYETKDDYSTGYLEKSKFQVVTENFKGDGSFNASNSTVGDINNYQTVNLLNSSAGNVERDTLSNIEYEYKVYEDEYGDSVANDASEIEKEYISAGSVTVKLDKNASEEENYYVGNIEGYANVNITGYTDKKDSSNNKKVQVGSISGGNYAWEYENWSEKYDDHEVAGSVKLDNANSGKISGFNTVALNNAEVGSDIEAIYGYRTTTFSGETSESMLYGSMTSSGSSSSNKFVYKSADKVTVAASTVNGSIKGYGNVSLTDSQAGNIVLGEAYTEEYKIKAKGGVITDTFVYTATKTASVTLKNSQVNSIDSYSKVTLVNSDVYSDIYQSGLVKVTAASDGASTSYNPYAGTWEYKATGSISITADKNATSEYYRAGNIYNYEKVTISGYEGKDGKDVFITTGSIYGGAFTAEGDVYMMNDFNNIINSGNILDGRECYATGSVTIKNNVTVEGGIYGYDKITLTDAEVDSVCTQEMYGGFNAIVGSSVTLNGSSVTYLIGYKNVSIAKGVNHIGYYYAVDAAEKLAVAQGATLKISCLQLDENDKLEVKGTVIFEGGTWDVAADQISGSGEIAATSWMLNYIDLASSSKVKLVDLGNTADGFVSSAAEAADNTAKKAVKWDGSEEYNGWLSGGGDGVLEDTVDYIKFTAKENGTLNFSSNGTVSLQIGNQEWSGYGSIDVDTGTTYTIKLEREESNSASYELSFLA